MAKKNNSEKKSAKENKQNKHYFKDMKAELKKVVWPTPKQLTNNTVAVIEFTLIIALIVFILDICFDGLNKYGITVLQEKVQSAYSSDSEEITESDGNETISDENETTSETEESESASEGENVEEIEEDSQSNEESTQDSETNE